MLIGIDVGGTFTDGVLFNGHDIVSSVKKTTREEDLQATLLGVLDELLLLTDASKLKRVVLSTTLVTNLLATNRGERTAVILLPGHGLPRSAYQMGDDMFLLKGSIDFRGREIEPLDTQEIDQCLQEIKARGIQRIAIASKFANRNDNHEQFIKKRILEQRDDAVVIVSSEMSAKLNFPRRAATAYFTAMTCHEWNNFADAIELAMHARSIKAEIHILKADGGTMPLASSRNRPCETVFSGPAASTMGGLALRDDSLNSVVVDIGGTTTDLSLIIAGAPLHASKGAAIENKLTHVNSLAVQTIPLGGDSVISGHSKRLVLPYRKGPAACFGGDLPTVTDAFNLHLNLELGDVQRSRDTLGAIAKERNIELDALCEKIASEVTHRLQYAIDSMFRQWEEEPAYKVWEVIHKKKFKLDQVIGIGAAAQAIVPTLATRMEIDSFLHRYSPVANALGASIVRPTLAVTLHLDTEMGTYTLDPGGFTGKVKQAENFQLVDAKNIARDFLQKLGAEMNVDHDMQEAEFFMEEQFNMIRGYGRVGKLFEVGIQIAPGFIKEYQGVSQ